MIYIATVSSPEGSVHHYDVQADDPITAEELVNEEIRTGELHGYMIESLEEGSVYNIY